MMELIYWSGDWFFGFHICWVHFTPLSWLQAASLHIARVDLVAHFFIYSSLHLPPIYISCCTREQLGSAGPQPWDVCTLSSLLPSVVDSFSAFSVSLLISIQASTSLHMQQLIRFTPLFLHHLVVLVIGAHSFTALGWIVPFFLHPRSTL